MGVRGAVVICLLLAGSGCTAVPGADAVPTEPSATAGSAILTVGDEQLSFSIVERCLLLDDGRRVSLYGWGEYDGEQARLEVRRSTSPAVTDATVDEIEVTIEDELVLWQAVPASTLRPEPLFTVEGRRLQGEGIALRWRRDPVEVVAGNLEVTCPAD